jgi:hypothetical protein
MSFLSLDGTPGTFALALMQELGPAQRSATIAWSTGIPLFRVRSGI